MNIVSELQAISDNIFTDELLEAIQEDWQTELDAIDGGGETKLCQEAARALAGALTKEQAAVLDQQESLNRKNLAYGLRFGLIRGVYAGFQQFFVKKTPADPFDAMVASQLLKLPAMKLYGPFYDRQNRAMALSQELEDQLEEDLQQHLLTLACQWEGRLYGVLRHAFYLGYHCALTAIEQVEPAGTAGPMVAKILMTEYKLGFTTPRREQALNAALRAHYAQASGGGAVEASPE